KEQERHLSTIEETLIQNESMHLEPIRHLQTGS
ncbi:uncharacterized protein METZ01_LOCUS342191, partial [marine metagenome]